MTALTVSIETDASKETVKARLEAAGLTVTRISVKSTASITPRDRFMRANALTDMPEGLSRMEQKAYVRGYAKGCHSYVKKHGAPSVTGETPDKTRLRLLTIDHEWDRHPTAHRAAMRELRGWQDRHPAEDIIARKVS